MVRLVSVILILVYVSFVNGNNSMNSKTCVKGAQYKKQIQRALLYGPIFSITNISIIRCVISCESLIGCLSVNFEEKDGTACYLYNVSQQLNGTQTETNLAKTYLEVNLFYIGSCDDLITANPSDSIHSIMLPSDKIIKAICRITESDAWTVFLRRFDGSVDFYRDWKSYKDGFGTISGEFWIGLETVHQLTKSRNYIVRFVMEDHNGQSTYAEYNGFKLRNESADYMLIYAGYIGGTAVDGLRWNNEVRFSTKDRDNDKWDDICATTLRSAGWYGKCANSDVFAAYMPGPQSDFAILRWSDQYQYKIGLSKIEMRIKKI